ncbi:hypothetical protein [Methanoregula sp.]|jgi:hypothetical protein|uniref:hypothetical protein n=1 Tax=Methanoregula sp. TaxID=2052170 RepID=UPI003C1F1032
MKNSNNARSRYGCLRILARSMVRGHHAPQFGDLGPNVSMYTQVEKNLPFAVG